MKRCRISIEAIIELPSALAPGVMRILEQP